VSAANDLKTSKVVADESIVSLDGPSSWLNQIRTETLGKRVVRSSFMLEIQAALSPPDSSFAVSTSMSGFVGASAVISP
jgi:hypothetical protein